MNANALVRKAHPLLYSSRCLRILIRVWQNLAHPLHSRSHPGSHPYPCAAVAANVVVAKKGKGECSGELRTEEELRRGGISNLIYHIKLHLFYCKTTLKTFFFPLYILSFFFLSVLCSFIVLVFISFFVVFLDACADSQPATRPSLPRISQQQ